MRQYIYDLATDKRNDFLANFFKSFLWIASVMYGITVRCVLLFYQIGLFPQRRLPKPVISIGNITWGGTGKTPLTMLIAEFLQEKNRKAVVLSRGYGKKSGGGDLNEEGVLLKEQNAHIRVFQNADRFRAGRMALKEGPVDVFLLDDGFQHWKLKRDLDIVLIDAQNPFGNRFLIPRGILRESLRQLQRADIIILTKTGVGQRNLDVLSRQIKSIAPKALLAQAVHEPVCIVNHRDKNAYQVSSLSGRAVCCFSAIGNPKSFEDLLNSIGARIEKHFIFMDHHIYTEKDLQQITAFCLKNKIDMLVTTQKDAVKFEGFLSLLPSNIHFFSLNIKMEFVRGKDEFIDRISALFSD